MFDRIVSHERALEAAQRLINSHFGGTDRARMSLPAEEDDDDVVITDYIHQQIAKETAKMQGAGKAASAWRKSHETHD